MYVIIWLEMIHFAKNFHDAGIALSGEYFVLECFMSHYVYICLSPDMFLE